MIQKKTKKKKKKRKSYKGNILRLLYTPGD